MKRLALILATTSAACVSGCAWLPKRAHWVEVRPVQTATPGGRSSDAYYASAKTSIADAQYGRAIEELRAARERDPTDNRVPEALAVVYDKLGRFDLSARYYAEALALAPDSPTVAHNLAYSRKLQGFERPTDVARAEPHAPASIALSNSAMPSPHATDGPAPKVEVPKLVSVSGNVMRLELPVAADTPHSRAAPGKIASPILAGSSLTIVDATGRKNGGDEIRTELVRRGWSVRAVFEVVPAVIRTSIHYAPHQVDVAKALAKTLPRGADLAPCTAACGKFRLVVGSDQPSATASRRAGPAIRG